MKNSHLAISACRHCQHYATEGRRGGHCKQLGAPVQGAWKACCLAIPPFAPTWETTDEISEYGVPSWLPNVPDMPTVAVASCDNMGSTEVACRSTTSSAVLSSVSAPSQGIVQKVSA